MKRTPVLAFGGYHLTKLLELGIVDWAPYVWVEEYAFVSDDGKYYWVLKTDEDSWISVTTNSDYRFASIGRIRKGPNGREFAHRIPLGVEAKLRQEVANKIRRESVPDLRETDEKEKDTSKVS